VRGSRHAVVSVLNPVPLYQIRVETTVQVTGIRKNTTNLDSLGNEGHPGKKELKTSRWGGPKRP